MKKNLIAFLLLFFLGFIPLISLLHQGLPLTHDGQDHVARIANFYDSLREGNIIPRWAENLNWGYGHPILMFLYPFPSYIASLFHFLGFSLVDSIKIVFGFTFIASGIAMYLWINEMINEKAGFLAAILYIFAPYRFIDLFVRGAIGEHAAFIFPPLILYFLLKISKKRSRFYLIGGSLSMAGLVLSHNAISLMFLPLIFLYIFYLAWQLKFEKYFIVSTLCIIILGFGLSAFFWVPAFFEGKYTLRDIVTKGTYVLSFVDFKNFLYGKWNYGITGQFSVQVGILHWFFALLSLPLAIYLFKRKNKLWIFTFILFSIFWISLFLMAPSSYSVWQKITILQKFQFPWRLLSIIVFITSVLGGLFILIFPKKLQLSIVFLFTLLALFLNKDYWKAKGYLYKPESFYTGIYFGTTDTGESAPIWSIRFMEKTPQVEIEIISGKAKIQKLKRNSTEHLYKIIAFDKTRIRENTLYFPGWRVFIDGKSIPIQFQDPYHRGLITFFVERGEHIIKIKFEETKLRLFSNFISGFSLVFIIIFFFFNKNLNVKK